MNTIERYNRSYWQWWKASAINFWTLPKRMKRDILEAIENTFWFSVWVLIALTFPISHPILTLIAMNSDKKRMEKRYGKDKLRRDNE